jgi:hypothetical protein
MDINDLGQIIELIDSAKEFKPIVTKGVAALMDLVREFAPAFDALMRYRCDQKVLMFNIFCSEGFTREEALLLTINAEVALKESLKSVVNKKPS